MAEQLKTIRTSGGDYSSLQAWEDAADDSSTTTDPWAAEVYGLDAGDCRLAGWLDDGGNHRIFARDNNKHNGILSNESSNWARIVSTGRPIRIQINNQVIDGLFIKKQVGTSWACIRSQLGWNGFTFKNNLCLVDSGDYVGSSTMGIACDPDDQSGDIINNIIFQNPTDATENHGIWIEEGCNKVAHNSVRSLIASVPEAVSTMHGIRLEGATALGNGLYSNVVSGFEDGDYEDLNSNGWGTTVSNNASEDTTAPGTSAQTSFTPSAVWIDPDDDLHLLTTDTTLTDNGRDSSGETELETDNQFKTRGIGGSYDIGALEQPVIPDATAMPIVAPDVAFTSQLDVSPNATAMPLVAPNVSTLETQIITPDATALTLSATSTSIDHQLNLIPNATATPIVAPDVIFTSQLDRTPDATAVTLVAPSVSVNQTTLINPDATTLTLSATSTSIDHQLNLIPDATALTLSATNVTFSSQLDVSPDAVTMQLLAPNASLSSQLDISPNTTTMVLSAGDVEVLNANFLTPDTVSFNLSVPSASIDLQLNLTPNALPLLLVIPSTIRIQPIIPDPLILNFNIPTISTLSEILTPDILSISFSVPDAEVQKSIAGFIGCDPKKRMPQAWIDIITNRLRSGEPRWANFNIDRYYYERLKERSRGSNFICREDLPERPPSPDNYTDFDSPRDTDGDGIPDNP